MTFFSISPYQNGERSDVGQPYRTDCRDMVLGSVLANATILNSVTGEPEVVDCREVVGGKISKK